MGTAVLGRLAATGDETLLATDADRGRVSAVTSLGAKWVADARDLAAAADIVLTILPGSEELQNAMSQVLGALRPAASWIDMTSAAPSVGVALRRQAGCACLEAPIGGGPEAMRQGRAQLFVGGDREIVEQHRALLERLGRIEHIGAAGAGYTAKLIVNLLWFTQAISLTEGLLLARSRAIEPDVLAPVLARSAAASAFVDHDLDRLLEGDYLTSFGVARCYEELQAVVSLAQETDLPFELSRLVRDMYGQAVDEFGPADGELLPVAMLERRAGVQLRRSE